MYHHVQTHPNSFDSCSSVSENIPYSHTHKKTFERTGKESVGERPNKKEPRELNEVARYLQTDMNIKEGTKKPKPRRQNYLAESKSKPKCDYLAGHIHLNCLNEI